MPQIPIWLSVTICAISGCFWIVATIGMKVLQMKRKKGAAESDRRGDSERGDSTADGGDIDIVKEYRADHDHNGASSD